MQFELWIAKSFNRSMNLRTHNSEYLMQCIALHNMIDLKLIDALRMDTRGEREKERERDKGKEVIDDFTAHPRTFRTLFACNLISISSFRFAHCDLAEKRMTFLGKCGATFKQETKL